MAGAFPISGQIDPKSFPFLLVDLHRNGATGSLKVEGPSYQKALYFRSGRILFGSSNDPRDQLGAILIETGTLTPEQLEDVNSKVGPGNPLAKVLADTGFVSQRELSARPRGPRSSASSPTSSPTPRAASSSRTACCPRAPSTSSSPPSAWCSPRCAGSRDRTFVLRHLDGLDVVLRPGARAAGQLAEIEPEAAGPARAHSTAAPR